MAKFVRKDVSNTIENNIITAAIISTNFIEEIYPLYTKQYIKNKFGQTLLGWCIDYFDKFGEAPRKNIQTIFELEKETLDEADAEIITIFLKTLSKNYVDDQGINEEYVLDQAMQYFRKREVEMRVENAQKLLDVGKIEAAEDEIFKMKKVVRLTSNWSNPMDDHKIHEVFDDSKKGILRFPGALGSLLGDLERGWFIAFLAPFKRGKTWLLQEAVVIAALSNLKAVFISLEMQDKNINERLYKRITAYGDEGKTDHAVPVFDCVRNQTGVCEKPIRKNKFILYDGEGDLPEFEADMEYRPCCVCKDIKKEQEDYELSTWFELMIKPEFTARNVNKKLKSFKRFYGDNIRTKCYPRFSATVADIRRDLDILEQTEGFIPDVISIDFAGIVKPDTRGGDIRNGIDDIWKSLAALAMERHAVLFSASQGNRGSLYKDNMDQADIAEWIGILGHVDGFVSVNQSATEKKRGVMRLGLLAHRHKEFHEKDHTMILQNLSLGQVHLDSHRM
jgi:hypothetical protein